MRWLRRRLCYHTEALHLYLDEKRKTQSLFHMTVMIFVSLTLSQISFYIAKHGY